MDINIKESDFLYCKNLVERKRYYRPFSNVTAAVCLKEYFFIDTIDSNQTIHEELSSIETISPKEIDALIDNDVDKELFLYSNINLSDYDFYLLKKNIFIKHKKARNFFPINIKHFDFELNIDVQKFNEEFIFDSLFMEDQDSLVRHIEKLFSITDIQSNLTFNYKKTIKENNIVAMKLALFAAMISFRMGMELQYKYSVNIEKLFIDNGISIIDELYRNIK